MKTLEVEGLRVSVDGADVKLESYDTRDGDYTLIASGDEVEEALSMLLEFVRQHGAGGSPGTPGESTSPA